jgi:hypothetical protein
MGSTSVVESARRALGPVGVFMPFSRARAVSADRQREAVRRLENAGYRAAWANEGVGGKDALVQLAVLLGATERMVFGTSIANVWARAPQTAHGAAAIVGYGGTAAIAAKVREHLAAGADHVMIMPIGTDFADGVDQLEQLAPTLAGVTR